MKVRCVYTKMSHTPKDFHLPEAGYGPDASFDESLTRGREYVVYGIIIHEGHMWYYICRGGIRDYPIMHPCALFDIVDNRLSTHWRCVFRIDTHSWGGYSLMELFAFPEWVDDCNYYERLLNNDTRALQTFAHYRDLMDAEFDE